MTKRKRTTMTTTMTTNNITQDKTMTKKQDHGVRLIITPKCYRKIMFFVNRSPVEVSGLGRIQKASDGTLVVTSVYVVDQENTAATTDLDKDAVSSLLYESREDAGEMMFWWHSHVNMGVFWSGTDMDTIREFGANGFLVATVFNKRAEMHSAIYKKGEGVCPDIFLDGIETMVAELPSKSEAEQWEAEYLAKCKTKAYVPTSKWNKGTSEKENVLGIQSATALEKYSKNKGTKDNYNEVITYRRERGQWLVGQATSASAEELYDTWYDLRKTYYFEAIKPIKPVNAKTISADDYMHILDIALVLEGLDYVDATAEDEFQLVQSLLDALMSESPVFTFKGMAVAFPDCYWLRVGELFCLDDDDYDDEEETSLMAQAMRDAEEQYDAYNSSHDNQLDIEDAIRNGGYHAF